MTRLRHPRCARPACARRLLPTLALGLALLGLTPTASAQLSGGIEGRFLAPKPAAVDAPCARTLLDLVKRGDDAEAFEALLEVLRLEREGPARCPVPATEPSIPA